MEGEKKMNISKTLIIFNEGNFSTICQESGIIARAVAECCRYFGPCKWKTSHLNMRVDETKARPGKDIGMSTIDANTHPHTLGFRA